MGTCPVRSRHGDPPLGSQTVRSRTSRLIAGMERPKRSATRYSVLLCGTVDLQIILCQQCANQSAVGNPAVGEMIPGRSVVSGQPVTEPRRDFLAGLQEAGHMCRSRWQDVLPQTAEA